MNVYTIYMLGMNVVCSLMLFFYIYIRRGLYYIIVGELFFIISVLIRSYFPLSATIFCPPRRTKGFSLLSGLGELFSRERSFLYIRIERCMSEKHEKKTLCLGAFVAKAEKSRKERNAICYKILSKECFAL